MSGRFFALVIIFLCHVSSIAFTQTWEIEYPTELQPGIFDLAIANDGHLIAVGGNGSYSPGKVTKIDTDGKVIWNRQFSATKFRQILPLSDGRYAAFGDSPNWYTFAKFDINGNRLFENRSRLDSLIQFEIVKAFQSPDDQFILCGRLTPNDSSSRGSDYFMAKVDQQGQILWVRSIDISTKDWCFNAMQTNDGHYVLSGLVQVGEEDRPFLIKLDAEAKEIWRYIDSNNYGFSFNDVVQVDQNQLIAISFDNPPNAPSRLWLSHFDLQSGTPGPKYDVQGLDFESQTAVFTKDKKLVIVGRRILDSAPVRYRIVMAKTSLTGDLIWHRLYGQPTGTQLPRAVVELSDGGFAIGGYDRPGSVNSKAVLIKTDHLGYSITNLIRGHVKQTLCNDPEAGIPLNNWFIEVQAPEATYYGLSDENGQYEVRVDSGQYEVKIIPPNIYWDACQPTQNVQLAASFDTIRVDFPMQVAYDCPLLRVDISTPLLRRCYENTYYVDYCNEGTDAAINAYLEVELDPFFIAESSEPTWTAREGQLLKFELGQVAVGQCGQVKIFGKLDCNKSALGQSHCTEAQIFPDSLCTPPGINWDGSSIEVSGACVGDSIEFRIKNVGIGNMEEQLQYIVIEDLVIHRSGYFQLDADEAIEIKTAANGATYRMEAEQSEGHPGSSRPTSIIEGCRLEGSGFTKGIVTQRPFDEGDPFIAIDCRENVGSWDPNDIRVFPKGEGAEHLIEADTELEYHIRFQNTGTDTAFKVLIQDTIPLNHLDISSLQIGSSSHPFTWDVSSIGVLSFLFEDIQLVDSTTNEPASHGFLNFKIHQKEGNPVGTIIANQAAIYFDFNEAVWTNIAEVKIRKPSSYRSIEEQFCTLEVFDLQRLTAVDTLSYSEVDSVLIYNIVLLPEHELITDTSLQSGQSYLDMEWLESQQLRDSFLNKWGCDSLIITNITVDSPTSTVDPLSFDNFQFKLYPNPAPEILQIEYRLEEVQTVSLSILDIHGRLLSQISAPSLNSTGGHRIRWPVQQLTPGMYFLQIQVGAHRILRKFVH